MRQYVVNSIGGNSVTMGFGGVLEFSFDLFSCRLKFLEKDFLQRIVRIDAFDQFAIHDFANFGRREIFFRRFVAGFGDDFFHSGLVSKFVIPIVFHVFDQIMGPLWFGWPLL